MIYARVILVVLIILILVYYAMVVAHLSGIIYLTSRKVTFAKLWVPSVMFGGGSSSNSAMDAVGLKMLLDITKSLEKTSK